MNLDIESIAEEKGKTISEAILQKQSAYPILLGKEIKKKGFISGLKKGFLEAKESKKLEREIYQRSLHEANIYFLDHGDEKFDDRIIETLKSALQHKLRKPAAIKIMIPEEMLAHLTKAYVIDFLLEKNCIVIF